MRRRSRPPIPSTLQDGYIPAPLGGMNTLDPIGAMPKEDAIWIYNMIAAEYGLRVRRGYQEYVVGLTGVESPTTVRSIIPFHGSHKNGSTDKLFAATTTGIWDVSAKGAVAAAWQINHLYAAGSYVANGGNAYYTAAGGTSAGAGGPTGTGTGIADNTVTWNYVGLAATQSIAYGSNAGDAGYGVSTVASTPAGRFLLFCDEVNGLYVYTEGGAWAAGLSGTTQVWQPQTTYAVGNQVVNGGNTYTCTTGGVSNTGAGPTGTGAGITDGATVVWTGAAGVAASNAIGPSLADQNNGYTANPANFVAAVSWKNRMWYVERDTSRAWYTAVNAVYGTVTSFDFGSKMRQGGPLVNLYNWSYDGGGGLDTLLVGISSAGDVVIYQGTDPSSLTTFGLKGTWNVGGVPYGRHIATEHGGDVLVLSNIGVYPLSKLVIGNPIVDRTQYATAKIGNLFANIIQGNASAAGWSLVIHPLDNALMILIPALSNPVPGQTTSLQQLVMSFTTRGWSQYQNVPMASAGVWEGQLYFGTADGRVCISTDYKDNVLLSTGAFTAVPWALLTSYQNLGNMRQKQVQIARPVLLSQTTNPIVQAKVKYNFDVSQDALLSNVAGATSALWDAAVWDTDVFGGDYNPTTGLVGAAGCGRDVAVEVQGSGGDRTIFTGVNVAYTQGGYL